MSNSSDSPNISIDNLDTSENDSKKTIMLGKFRLIALLGEGGMGKVVRAEDTKLKRHVALKCLKKKKGAATYRAEQFIREARSAATLEHPHIVQIYEVGEHEKYLYIAMELIEGGTLKDLIKACGPLDILRACSLTAEAAEALAYASSLGITHRDIKPDNLMLTRAGRCKITDFGLAAIDDPADAFQLPNGVVGTPAYMAPEVIQKLPASSKSDVYSLACVLFYLVTGRPPFKSKNRDQLLQMQVETPAPDVASIRPDLPESLSRVLARALSKNPEDRPSPDKFAKQLRAHTIPGGNPSGSQVLSGSHTPFIPNITAPSSSHKPKWPLYTAVGGGIAAIIAIAVTITVISLSNRPQPAAARPVIVQIPAAQLPAPTPVAVPAPTPTPIAPTPVAAENPQSSPLTPQPTSPVEPAAKKPIPSSAVKVTDTTAILNAARQNRKIAITALIASVQINNTDKVATLTFADNTDFKVLYYQRLYGGMSKKFGGKDGNALAGKTVILTGYPTMTDNHPTLILSSTSQIDLAQ